MTLLVEYKCEKTIPSIYQLSTKHARYINTSERERESKRKHERIILRFEHRCSTSPPSTL